jgi:hypothetical protein
LLRPYISRKLTIRGYTKTADTQYKRETVYVLLTAGFERKIKMLK